jgi:hypothetical protein
VKTTKRMTLPQKLCLGMLAAHDGAVAELVRDMAVIKADGKTLDTFMRPTVLGLETRGYVERRGQFQFVVTDAGRTAAEPEEPVSDRSRSYGPGGEADGLTTTEDAGR